jgi:hypothetical protein
MKFKHPEIGVCGLSCRLCAKYYLKGKRRCPGCKSEAKLKRGCPFVTCAVKSKRIEFCWQCPDKGKCRKWNELREMCKHHRGGNYRMLESNTLFVSRKGLSAFMKDQKEREKSLKCMLCKFDEGRSGSLYCYAAAVMDKRMLASAVREAGRKSKGMNLKGRSQTLQTVLRRIAETRKRQANA